ncbi:MAG: hypothetical protein LBS27_06510, partial [Bifidobacteriaceae bacterium]|nr:hypothetical protein [Bifidobacteriaceae bacterium]
MAAATVVALGGFTLAQSFTDSLQAQAVPPAPEISFIEFDPHPGPAPVYPNALPADGSSTYRVIVVGMGLDDSGQQVPAEGPIEITLTPLGETGPEGLVFISPALGKVPDNRLGAVLPAQTGQYVFEVASWVDGVYKVEVKDQDTGEVIAEKELPFAPAPLPDANESWAKVVTTGTVKANRGDPALENSPEDWGRHTITVQLLTAEGEEITDPEPPLDIEPASTDPLQGDGIAFFSDKKFECVDGLEDGFCYEGLWQIDVASTKAGLRQLQVSYAKGTDREFYLVNANNPTSTVLTAQFTAELSLQYSTLVVSPSDVADDPDSTADPVGVPQPIGVGESYTATVTLWDAGRNNRAGDPYDANTRIELSLAGEDCSAVFADGSRKRVTYYARSGRLTESVIAETPGQCELSAEVLGDTGGLLGTQTLRWVEGDVDPASAKTWFNVSPGAVLANGQDEGLIEVQLYGLDNLPVTGAADLIDAWPPQGSGVQVEPFAHDAGGRYTAVFRGSTAGIFQIGVTVDGQALAVQAQIGNDLAQLVDPAAPPAAGDLSGATVTREDEQQANRGAPGSTVAEWGRQTITATLKGEDGAPVTLGANGLAAAAAPGDPLNGVGLYFGNGGAFACAEAPVGADCTAGVYTLDVYSSKAGERQLKVTYLAGTADAVTLVNGDNRASKVLRALFTTPPISPADSMLIVTPSDPVDDPNDPATVPLGVPTPIAYDSSQRYKVQVVAWDAGRNNRVGGAQIDLGLSEVSESHGDCDGPAAVGSQLTTSATGRAETQIETSGQARTCLLQAYAENGQSQAQVGGSPKILRWVVEQASLDNSEWDIQGEPVVADGATFGTIHVVLQGQGGELVAPAVGQANRLAVVVPEGSGIEVSPFYQDSSSGFYRAHFTGAVSGDWPLSVTYDGQPLTTSQYRVIREVRFTSPTGPSPSAAGSAVWVEEEDSVPSIARPQPAEAADPYIDRGHVVGASLRAAPGGDLLRTLGGGLTWAPAADDQYDGEGLFALRGDSFYENTDCDARTGSTEWYCSAIEIYSTFPGERRIVVQYQDYATGFELTNLDNPTSNVLTLVYGPPDAYLPDSTLTVSPSEPEDHPLDPGDDPDGRPVPIPAGDMYEVVLTAWDQGRTNRAQFDNSRFELRVDGDNCDARMKGARDPAVPSGWGWGKKVLVPSELEVNEDGQLITRVYSEQEGDCQLHITESEGYPIAGEPKTLRWTGPSWDLAHVNTWFEVSQEPVVADGVATGTVTVQLRDADNQPVLDAAEFISLWTPPSTGVGFGDFRHVGGGVYRALFTGTVAGYADVSADMEDGSLNVRSQGLGTANLVAAPAAYGPDPAKSAAWAELGARPAANSEQLRITVELKDASGEPVTDPNPPLSIAAATTDPLLGVGLEFPNGGQFACVNTPDQQGHCPEGLFYVEVFSVKAGVRELEVTYGAGTAAEFKLSNRYEPGSTVFAEFYAAYSDSDTTVVISPSDPVDNPDLPQDPQGVPEPLAVGQAYDITITLWDAGRVNRVAWGEPYQIYLECAQGAAHFPSGDSELETVSGEDGRITTRVVSYAPDQCELDYGALTDTRVLSWGDAEVDPDSPKTWFNVSPGAVLADGVDTGSIEVQLYGVNDLPATELAGEIQATPPPASGLDIGAFAHEGAGRYVATFTGDTPGSFEIAVTAKGLALAIQQGIGNAFARLSATGGPPIGGELSYAQVTQTAEQPANRGRPNSTVAEWGRQTITATLKDADGDPVTNAAAGLVAAAAPGDAVGGIGLYFGNNGAFACAQAPVAGGCAAGVYTLDVYSSKAGERQLKVTYLPGTPNAVTLVVGQRGTSSVLRTVFTTPPYSRTSSTLVVSPSTPEDNPDDPYDEPDGVPVTLPFGTAQRYQVTVTAWDEGRNNRVAGEDIELEIACDGAEALFVGGGDNTVLTTSAVGRVEVEVYQWDREQSGPCYLTAFATGSPDSGYLGGTPKLLQWAAPAVDVDAEDTLFRVDAEPVTANGVQLGQISVTLMGTDGDAARWQQELLEVVAPDEAGLDIRDFVAEWNGYDYVAYFTGTVPGDFELSVTYDGQPLSAGVEYLTGTVLDVAHLVAPTGPGVAPSDLTAIVSDRNETVRAMQPPGPGEDLGAWADGEHWVEVDVAGGSGAWNNNGGLRWEAADEDPYDGAGLYDLSEGVFRQHLFMICWPDACSGIGIYSSLPGPRYITVYYEDSQTPEFALANADEPTSTTLRLDFAAPAASLADSTLTVSPSDPADFPLHPLDAPDGVASPIPAGQVYDVALTPWDKGRTLRASFDAGGGGLSLVEEPACQAVIKTAGDSDDPATWTATSAQLDGLAENAEGQLVAQVYSPGASVCALTATFAGWDNWWGPELDLPGAPKTLRWLSATADTTHPNTWFAVSPDQVAKGGANSGTVTIQLRDAAGQPAIEPAGLLGAQGQDPGSGLSISPFTHLGGGLYTASFTGAVVGSHTVTATVNSQPLSVRSPGEDIANIVPSGTPGGPDPDQSWGQITDGSQLANREAPDASEHPESWGRHTLTVHLEDSEGSPVTTLDQPLIVRASESDQLQGAGLWLQNGGVFECAEELDQDDKCAQGVYQVEIYSGLAGLRWVEAVYAAETSGQFKVVSDNGYGDTDFAALFVAQQDNDWSTVVVMPSEPQDDPNDPDNNVNGVPVPIAVGDPYTLTVTAWDAGRVNRAPEAETTLYLEGQDCTATFPDGSQSRVVRTNTDGRAVVQVVSEELGECELASEYHWPGAAPQILTWGDPELDAASQKTWLAVSAIPVRADGTDQGHIEIQLFGVNGRPLVLQAANILIDSPPNSGIQVSTFAHQGSGRYTATFTGQVVGDWTLAATVDGTPLSIQPGIGNATAHLVDPVQPPPASNQSRAQISARPDQLANYGRPGSTVNEWGRQTITVTLKDAAGDPITDGAGSLTPAAAPGDPLTGVGLHFGNGGAFVCAAAPVNGECLAGVYRIDLYSSKAVERQVTVTYLAGTADQLVLVNGDQPASRVLRAVFTTPPFSRLYSTVTVSPSNPADDPDSPYDEPDGVPLALSAGEHYQVTVTTWDEGRNNRVGGINVELKLESIHSNSTCEARFDGGSSSPQYMATTSANGRITIDVYLQSWALATSCVLIAESDDSSNNWADPGPLDGSGKLLVWTSSTVDVNSPETSFEVDGEPVVANGVDLGWIRVTLDADGQANGWQPATGEAGRLAVIVPPGSQINVRAFAEVQAGMYRAYYTGAVVGDHQLAVTWSGQALQSGGDPPWDTAHLTAPHQGPATSAGSHASVFEETPPATLPLDEGEPQWATGYSWGHIITVHLVDASGAPVTDAAGALSWAPANLDSRGGEGLFRLPGEGTGEFSCAVATNVEGHCEAGEYLSSYVYSAFSGERLVNVFYDDGTQRFGIVDRDDATNTDLSLVYGPPRASSESTVVVSPSVPQDDPDDPTSEPNGQPVALAQGELYTVVVTLWGEDRTERAGGADTRLELVGEDCQAHFEDLTVPEEQRGSTHLIPLDDFVNGRGSIDVHSVERGICLLTVTIGSQTPAGSGKVLRWTGSGADLGQAETWFTVSAENVAADGVDTGVITVSLRDSEGDPVFDAASYLSASGPAGSGISAGAFESVGGGVYTASFVGTVAGSHLITVLADGQPVTVLANGNAHANVGGAPPARQVDPSQSEFTTDNPGTVVAIGGAHWFEVNLRDQYGDAWTDPEAIAFSYRLQGSTSWTPDTKTETSPIRWSLQPTVAGSYEVKAEVQSQQIGQVLTVDFGAAPPELDPDASVLEAVSEGEIRYVGTGSWFNQHQFRATLVDQYGDPVLFKRVVFSWRLSGDTTWTVGSENTAGLGGLASWMSFTVEAPGVYEVRATVEGVQIGEIKAVEFAWAELDYDAIRTSFTKSSGVQEPPDGEHTASVVVRDLAGHARAGVDVSFELVPAGLAYLATQGGGAALANPEDIESSATGWASVAVRATGATTAHLIVKIGTEVVGEADFVFEAPSGPPALDPAESSLIALTAGQNVLLDGNSAHELLATLVDQYGDPWTQDEVVEFYYREPGAPGWRYWADLATYPPGSATAHLRPDLRVEGIYEAKAEVNGIQIGTPVTVGFVLPQVDFDAVRGTFWRTTGVRIPDVTTHAAGLRVTDTLGFARPDVEVVFELDSGADGYLVDPATGQPLAGRSLVVSPDAVTGAASVNVGASAAGTVRLSVYANSLLMGEADFDFAAPSDPPVLDPAQSSLVALTAGQHVAANEAH